MEKERIYLSESHYQSAVLRLRRIGKKFPDFDSIENPEKQIRWITQAVFGEAGNLQHDTYPSELSEYRGGFLNAVLNIQVAMQDDGSRDRVLNVVGFTTSVNKVYVVWPETGRGNTSQLFVNGYIDAVALLWEYAELKSPGTKILYKTDVQNILAMLHNIAMGGE